MNLISNQKTYILAGPSGQHCRCYGVVDVSVRSVFWCSKCTGAVDIWGPSGIVARRHLCNCAKTSRVLKYWPCQNIVCQNINSAKPLTVPKHWPCQNIYHAKTSTTAKISTALNHQLCQNIDQAKTVTTAKHLLLQLTLTRHCFDTSKILSLSEN